MPAVSDILQFQRGQLLQTPTLPNAGFAGKTIIVTGANSGLGFEVAKQLVQLNVSTLILGCRSTSKGEAAKAEILGTKKTNTTIHVWPINMSSFASVKAFSDRANNELPRLDAVLANAGISTNLYNSAEGFEETLTVNVISTFLLSVLCLPALQRTAAQTGSATHVTITGSNVHSFADHKQLQACPRGKIFKTLSDEKSGDMAARYFLSKLILQLCAQELAEMMRKSGSRYSNVILNVPSPGWCKTPLFRQDDGGFAGRNILKLIGRTGEVGARCLTSALAAEEDSHGQYLSECQVKRASVWVRSQEGQKMQKQVWAELYGILQGINASVSQILA